MNVHRMPGLDARDPLGFLAALGVLRTLSHGDRSARLHWERDGSYVAVVTTSLSSVIDALWEDVERSRQGDPAIDFALDADRKEQDLKHPPDAFRKLMRSLVNVPEAAQFVAAYATGVVVDGSGQTKPTSFHMTAGQQRFMDVIIDLRDKVTRRDLEEALDGPWIGRDDVKDPRWRAGSERLRALLSFDPSKTKAAVAAGAAWLAFRALPLFPVVPRGTSAVTTGFTGRGRSEQFTWPVWSIPLLESEARVVLGLGELERMTCGERSRRGIVAVLRSSVQRSSQGYGNFTASIPV